MRSAFLRVICHAFGAGLLALAACHGGDDHVSPPPPGGGATGALSLTISGLPSGVPANVSVVGPGGFKQTVAQSTTLTGLAAGAYTITGNKVLSGVLLYSPTQVTQSAQVSAGAQSSVTVAHGAPETYRLALPVVVSGLDAPIFLAAPANDARLFVVERAGRIRVVRNGALLSTPFLDISAWVSTENERGLLSMAFDPAYATNGRFYVYYTAQDGAITVARYQVSSANPDVANANGVVLLSIAHPLSNHNGGQLAFGPDGMLYLATGDGGASQDPSGNAQNTSSLLGKMLRLDVRGSSYALPSDNPFVNGGGRGEIWALGLRNPWRFSFDTTGLIYLADVGEGSREEVNVVSAAHGGLNYGWNRVEGTLCAGGAASCDTVGLTPPVFEYSHANGGCAIVGGYVYRGSAMPELQGRYFYSDLCTGKLQSLVYRDGAVTEAVDWSLQIPGTVYSFGSDAAQALYVLAQGSAPGGGQVLRIQRAQ
jgi:glucose/arabinose dehydrogenase